MRILLIYFLILVVIPQTINAQNFKTIVAFGDSFTDNGHIDGHGFNRDSNGKVWVEHLKDMLGSEALDNRAWGGARTDDGHFMGYDWSGFNWQVDKYENIKDTETTLVTVWIGVNDYWDAKDDPLQSVGNIRKGLEKLIEKSAKNIVVFNNFDLTISLGYGPTTQYHKLVPEVKKLTKKFNAGLHDMLYNPELGLSQNNPDIKFYFIDVYAFMNDLVSSNDFKKVPWKDDTYKYPDPKAYLWYDEWHPMTHCHYQIAEMVLKVLRK
jgi:phospholipase/lecithinase/hemolysin